MKVLVWIVLLKLIIAQPDTLMISCSPTMIDRDYEFLVSELIFPGEDTITVWSSPTWIDVSTIVIQNQSYLILSGEPTISEVGMHTVFGQIEQESGSEVIPFQLTVEVFEQISSVWFNEPMAIWMSDSTQTARIRSYGYSQYHISQIVLSVIPAGAIDILSIQNSNETDSVWFSISSEEETYTIIPMVGDTPVDWFVDIGSEALIDLEIAPLNPQNNVRIVFNQFITSSQVEYDDQAIIDIIEPQVQIQWFDPSLGWDPPSIEYELFIMDDEIILINEISGACYGYHQELHFHSNGDNQLPDFLYGYREWVTTDGGNNWEDYYGEIINATIQIIEWRPNQIIIGMIEGYTYSDSYFGSEHVYENIVVAGMECMPGDLNYDSIINILDIVINVNCIMVIDDCPCGDHSGDGILNVLDIIQMINVILSG